MVNPYFLPLAKCWWIVALELRETKKEIYRRARNDELPFDIYRVGGRYYVGAHAWLEWQDRQGIPRMILR